MPHRIILLLNNIAVVCETESRSSKSISNAEKFKPQTNVVTHTYVIPLAFSFSAFKSAPLLSVGLTWNGLFNDNDPCA